MELLLNRNCPCPSTKCSVKGNCERCFAKHRNTRTSCVKQSILNDELNVNCPKDKKDKSFGQCKNCREFAEKEMAMTFCQELGHKIYEELNK